MKKYKKNFLAILVLPIAMVIISLFINITSVNAGPVEPQGQIWVHKFNVPCQGGGYIWYYRCEPGDVIIECSPLWSWNIERNCSE